MKTIILRHDFDWDSGLDKQVALLFDIERKYNVRSTIFLRHDRGVSDLKYKDFYQKLEKEGWEFGLHLANHENRPGYELPTKELEIVKRLGLNIRGVSACGGTYNWIDPKGWLVQDSLGLKYVCPSALKIPDGYKMKSIISPTHITLDGTYLWQQGDAGYANCISDFEKYITDKGVLGLLSHNTWFYNKIQPKQFPHDPLKAVTNTIYYERFLQHFTNKPGEYKFETFAQYLKIDLPPDKDEKLNTDNYDVFYSNGGFNYNKQWGENFIKTRTIIPKLPKNYTILDVGCGDGFWSNILSEYHSVIGIDVSKGGIEMAKLKYKDNAKTSFERIGALDYKEKHDIVFCRACSLLSCPTDSEKFEKNSEYLISLAKEYFIYVEYSKPELYNSHDGRWYHKNPYEIQEKFRKYGETELSLTGDNYMVITVKIKGNE